MAISRDELLRLARAGAAARVQELQNELESIYRTFPDLRATSRARTAAPAKRSARAATAKRAWSAADRKAVSERMKKYWAAKRGTKSSK